MSQLKYVLDVQFGNNSASLLLLCLLILKSFVFLAPKHRHAVEARLHNADSRRHLTHRPLRCQRTLGSSRHLVYLLFFFRNLRYQSVFFQPDVSRSLLQILDQKQDFLIQKSCILSL